MSCVWFPLSTFHPLDSNLRYVDLKTRVLSDEKRVYYSDEIIRNVRPVFFPVQMNYMFSYMQHNYALIAYD